ncbi:mpv17-like protein [Haematobia irritans]|uniref:mpv17-like protein n=1 Tax=Haematobia irritans TaxID=7368 RepID=UPI003F504339
MPLVVNFVKSQWRAFITTHPFVRGVITYAVLWPTSSLVQQTIEGKNFRTYDYMRAFRFCILGSMYAAPVLYGWVRVSSAMWPNMSLRVGLTKAAVEQVSYGPFACVSFFTGMTLLEGKSLKEAIQEAKNKFVPTFKVGIYIWPILQTINFSIIPERHRMVYVSICSFLWTICLAYIKEMQVCNEPQQLQSDHQTVLSNSTPLSIK